MEDNLIKTECKIQELGKVNENGRIYDNIDSLSYDTKLIIIDGVTEHHIDNFNQMKYFLIETINREVISLIELGYTFRIDFKKKLIKINNKSYDFTIPNPISNEKCIEKLEELYHDYKYSVPSERSEKKKRFIRFKALSSNEMSAEDLAIGKNREIARFLLEEFVLFSYYNGDLKIDGWFWQSKVNKEFIILKSWFE